MLEQESSNPENTDIEEIQEISTSESPAAPEQTTPDEAEPQVKQRSDNSSLNLIIAITAIVVLVMLYLVLDKASQVPDPARDVKTELIANQKLIHDKQAQLKAIQERTRPKEQLAQMLTVMDNTITETAETQKAIEKEKTRIAGMRGSIRSYFERYRRATRAKAKGRQFSILRTVHSGKTYLNVEITRVNNESIQITHEQGSTTISSGDLPDELREELAFGDPLNIKAMNQTDASLAPVVVRPLPQKSPAPVTNEKKLVAPNLESPSGQPKIDTPTYTEPGTTNEPLWSPPAHSPLPPL